MDQHGVLGRLDQRPRGLKGPAEVQRAHEMDVLQEANSPLDVHRRGRLRLGLVGMDASCRGKDRKRVVVLRVVEDSLDDFDLGAGQQPVAVAGRLEEEDPIPPLPLFLARQLRPPAEHEVF